ncbi:MAG: zinc ribbon domain-containing protein [Chloroflexi bacterium]|nr:zinc ribbon domain-containing protein [Chloroflexota bacterium]
MPVYEYKCQACGRVFELLVHSFHGSENPKCPGCDSHKLDRMLSAPSLLKHSNAPSTTCCGRTERCESPPCSTEEGCHRK